VEENTASPITETRCADGTGLLTLRGRLGTAEARAVWEAGLRLGESGREVVVDCRDLEQIGGAVLQVLLALALELRRVKGRLALRGASPAVLRTVALAGLSADLVAA
jgi:anti-anti-sigma factor